VVNGANVDTGSFGDDVRVEALDAPFDDDVGGRLQDSRERGDGPRLGRSLQLGTVFRGDFCHLTSIHRKLDQSLNFSRDFSYSARKDFPRLSSSLGSEVVTLDSNRPLAEAVAKQNRKVLNEPGYQ
jgi:hypothetical protein